MMSGTVLELANRTPTRVLLPTLGKHFLLSLSYYLGQWRT